MKTLVLHMVMLLLVCRGTAQTVINVDKAEGGLASNAFFVVGGSPVSTARYVKIVSGSPYFSEEKMSGSLQIAGGKIVDSLLLRLDLVDNTVLYTSPKGDQEMVATSPVVKVTLNNLLKNEHYVFVHSSGLRVIEQAVATGWYQLLSAGNATLYKKTNKVISSIRPYNSATFEEQITETSSYFLLYKNGLIAIKKLNTVPDILIDKKAALQEFLKKNKSSGKKDSDYIGIIEYYNGLQPK